MFFPRLRKQARWMFVLLALVFAVGFVGFGVGSGSTGIGDLLRGNFNLFGHHGGGGTSVKKAEKEIAAHPNQPKGYRDLATAYQDKKQGDRAIAPLERYSQLRPKDQDALRELAGLYLDQATRYQTAAQAAQLENPLAISGQLFQPTGKLATALGTDPVATAVSSKVSTAVQDQVIKMQTAQQNALVVYRRLTAVAPTDPNAYFELAQAAESIRDYPTAIKAYRKVIKLEPDSSDVPAIKQRIKQLQGVGSVATSG